MSIKYYVLLGLAVSPAFPAAINSFTQQNLVSDIPGVAQTLDPNLVNPWGIAQGPGPIWVSDNKTGVSTLYTGTGSIVPLVVTIPPPAGGAPPSAPTGVAFNGSRGSFGGALFVFSTEDGTISSWSSGTNAVLQADNSASGAVYKGVALTGNQIFATNFNSGKVDVFDTNFHQTGSFTDPTVPAGFAPFGIQNIGGKLYVTFAKQDAAKHDDVAGAGNGFVDAFNPDGTFARVTSAGALDSPWGLAVAPAGYGTFGGDLLIGNFGDGMINAFDANGNFQGTLKNPQGTAIVNIGLWGLDFGNGNAGTSPNSLYFTAGIPGNGAREDHGLFGSLQAVPEPASAWVTLLGLIGMAAWGGKRLKAKRV